jgi:hypothetical protein
LRLHSPSASAAIGSDIDAGVAGIRVANGQFSFQRRSVGYTHVAMPIFPPLTANEEAVLEILASGSASESAELIAERAGLGREQAERALRSLEARNPPLAIGGSDGGTRWKPAEAIAALLA